MMVARRKTIFLSSAIRVSFGSIAVVRKREMRSDFFVSPLSDHFIEFVEEDHGSLKRGEHSKKPVAFGSIFSSPLLKT